MNDSDDSKESCVQCGKMLAKSSGQTICPACLMRLAIHPSLSEIATPAIDLTQSVVMKSGATHGSDFPDLEPNQKFGDYSIVRRLGHGGMGVV